MIYVIYYENYDYLIIILNHINQTNHSSDKSTNNQINKSTNQQITKKKCTFVFFYRKKIKEIKLLFINKNNEK